MKKIDLNVIVGTSLSIFSLFIVIQSCVQTNNETKSTFELPNNEIGEFASIWFDYINARTSDYFTQYDPNEEWLDHNNLIRKVSNKLEGIEPYLISIETDTFLSIYSKEKKGSWVKVNLGLNKNKEITEIGLKKSFKAVDYDLKDKITQSQKKKIINEISDVLRSKYVIENSREKFASEIEKNFINGNYDNINQGDLFSDILTDDLFKISNDKHLQIIPPSRISEVQIRFGANDENEVERVNDSDDQLSNESFVNYNILENNVGYIKIERFVDNEKTKNDTRDIFNNLIDTKAIIIDLRYSGGGDGLATANLISYVITKGNKDQNSNELNSVFGLEESLKNNDLNRYFNSKPLYILTSSKTISAGEALVYYLKKINRATIIGEKTAGAGYLVDAFKLSYDFYFVNSITTKFDYGDGWEGKGIKPDVEIKSSDALGYALNEISKY